MFLNFFSTGFFMETIMILYVVCSHFPIGFQKLLHMHLLHLQILPTRFFEDCIYSM
jgi:hypothetical protein